MTERAVMKSGLLSNRKIASGLKNRAEVIVFDELDSTNEEAKRRIRSGLIRKTTLLLAEGQTAGKGRVGHSFYSPKREGLYMSLAFLLDGDAPGFLRVTGKAAVAVVEGIQRCARLPLSIKWVNDVYSGTEKIAGILAEHLSDEDGRSWVVVGIGINVTTSSFPEDLQGKASSICLSGTETRKTNLFLPDRNDLAVYVTDALLSELSDLSDLNYLEIYRSCSNVLGHEVLYARYETDGSYKETAGMAIEIDDDGALIVLLRDGTTERLDSGEIRVRALERG